MQPSRHVLPKSDPPATVSSLGRLSEDFLPSQLKPHSLKTRRISPACSLGVNFCPLGPPQATWCHGPLGTAVPDRLTLGRLQGFLLHLRCPWSSMKILATRACQAAGSLRPAARFFALCADPALSHGRLPPNDPPVFGAKPTWALLPLDDAPRGPLRKCVQPRHCHRDKNRRSLIPTADGHEEPAASGRPRPRLPDARILPAGSL